MAKEKRKHMPKGKRVVMAGLMVPLLEVRAGQTQTIAI